MLALPGDAGDDNGIGDTLVYVIPAIGLVLAIGGIAFALTRWRRRPRNRPAISNDSTRVDLDMERYDL